MLDQIVSLAPSLWPIAIALLWWRTRVLERGQERIEREVVKLRIAFAALEAQGFRFELTHDPRVLKSLDP